MLRRRRDAEPASGSPPADAASRSGITGRGAPVDPARSWDLVVVDPESGRHVDVGVRLTFRDLEILGSAGRFYGEHYANAERPAEQVEWRRTRARTVGEALWEAATDRVGIQPVD